ncbi:MFS transporter [Streptomyces meridianus]|uniref:MFS transporter n=1 Tax=Streptomyces meridianus TaxID=2938945 RepID=A0ABT0X973_9ACTN|nr:MFS transporter [Streptomyces meridianus]MCM2579085.1 MFS transporter [Streptomyces meridianus]
MTYCTRLPRLAPAGHESPRRRPHRAWWVVAAAGLTTVVAGSFTTVPGLLTEPLHREFGWSRGSIGLAASVAMVLYGLIAPFAAALMDRFGARRVVAGALALLAAGAALTSVMTRTWQFTLLWGVLTGLGSGSLALAFAASVAGRWFTERRGLVTGLLTAASGTGQLVLLPLLARIVEQYGWRPAVVTLALAAAVTAVPAWLLLRDQPADAAVKPYGAREFEPKPAPAPGAAGRTVRVLAAGARTGPFWVLAGTFAVCGASTNGIMWTAFVPAAHDHGMPATTAASLLAAIGVFNLAGTVLSGRLTDRFDARRLLALHYALRALTLLLLPPALAPAVGVPMIVFVVLFGLLDLATVPPTIALCRQLYGDDGPVLFGWANTAHQAGAASAAFLGGTLRDGLGSYDLVWVGTGALCAAASLTVLVLRTPARADGRQARDFAKQRLSSSKR